MVPIQWSTISHTLRNHYTIDICGYSTSSRICLIALRFQLFIAFTERKKKVPFSMAIGNGELMHECFPKHLRMGTVVVTGVDAIQQAHFELILSSFRYILMTLCVNANLNFELDFHYSLIFFINNNIYHDFLPTPRRSSHVKSGKTHTQSSRYTPQPI